MFRCYSSIVDQEPFFEVQVWHRAGKAETRHAEPSLLLDAHPISLTRASIDIQLIRVGYSKAGPFFTIHCNKGLKVQDLFLVCILKLEQRLFVSDPTFFPSRDAKKVRTRSRQPLEATTPYSMPSGDATHSSEEFSDSESDT